MGTSSGNTPRIFTRGETTQFQVGFFADNDQTTPLLPITPAYPSYEIIDPNGTTIQAGVGSAGTNPGNYILDWTVPKDAILSYYEKAPQQFNNQNEPEPLTANEARYRIQWQIVTGENFSVNFVEEFDVRDVAVTQSLSRELKYMVLERRPFRLMYRSTVLPYNTNLRFIIRGHDRNPVIEEDLFTGKTPYLGDIQYRQDGDSYILYYDVPEDTTHPNTAYMALWDIQETEFSVPRTEWQIVTVISVHLLPLITSLRMLIDRFQKRLGRIQAYEDSDLLEYIARGMQYVNMSHPATEFRIGQLPDSMMSLVLLAAGWHGLQAQQILQTELDIQFSGQQVTLNVAQQAGLDAAANRMMEMFNKEIGPVKMAYVRRARGLGTVAGRAYNYRQMYQYVYKISTLGSDALLNTLTKIGLL